jgi:hypothetical protein
MKQAIATPELSTVRPPVLSRVIALSYLNANPFPQSINAHYDQ